MSDTLQVVHWSLGADGRQRGDLWLPEGRDSLEEVLWESIRRLDLERRMRSAFQVTRPLWYGLWVDSPLTAAQCALLRDVFQEVVRQVPRLEKHLEEFARALAEAAETGAPLHIELSPPGHIDLGWVTTFVHCPRCKAEGPVERWQEKYSEEPLECPVCGHSYVPAATCSSERELFAETVCCRSCGGVHRVRDFSEEAIQTLEDRHTFESFNEELRWLNRVEAFYQRHPDLQGAIEPDVMRILESRDPEVMEAMCAGTPFDEIELPPDELESLGPAEGWSDEDRDVVDYLRHNHFSLPARKPFVEESIARLGSQLFQGSPVKCTVCGGDLA